MNAFERRHFRVEDIQQIPQGDILHHPLYSQLLNLYQILPGEQHLPTETVIRVMDHVLGRYNTEFLLAGNAPTVLINAGMVIADQLRTYTVPDKDLQVNLMINILKENAHVENIPVINRLQYVNDMLARMQFDTDFVGRVYAVLSQNGCMQVPWILIEQYPGMAVNAA